MVINKLLTKANFKKGNNRKIKYIVIHYVGAEGGAEANCKYFERFYRGASAHYFIGHNGEVWQCVEDSNIAWHCGAVKYKHKECRNDNSIGIEMCCRKGSNWYFEQATITSTIGLVKELMAKHNIPIENVIRHFDVTGKKCPEPYVRNNEDWEKFKAQLTTVKPEHKKTNEAIAKEVVNGLWGNGTERQNRLAAAGYDYKVIQALVNKLINDKGTTANKKTNEEIAKEVIAGKWGNGKKRKQSLTAAGYDYAAIQKLVNKLLK